MEAYLDGTRINFAKAKPLGEGGEAEVFIYGGQALKIFKPPTHPSYEGFPKEQEGARERLTEHQRKLADFPHGLPSRVIVPERLVTNKKGEVIGYTMRLLSAPDSLRKFSERIFRDKGVDQERVRKILQDMHATVSGLHNMQVVVGDFNDLNILVEGEEANFIDADSFQFGSYLTKVFTSRFVDPTLCDPREESPLLYKPYTPLSDWYSYAVLAFQSFLLVDPYGGVYLPKDKAKKISHDARPMRRVSVFDPEVRYPKPAIPMKVLPDNLLGYFAEVFEKDRREDFPFALLEGLRWTKCSICGTEHARAVCPDCGKTSALPVKVSITVHGKVTCARVFKTRGQILSAAFQDKRLLFVYHEDNEFKREDKTALFSGSLDPALHFQISGRKTLVAKGGQLITLELGAPAEKLSVETCRKVPVFDANSTTRFWVDKGQLLKDGRFGPEYIGDVLSEQTRFWVGEHFGFGFYRAGALNTAFVFDTLRRGIKDDVKITPVRGQLIDAKCYLSSGRAWFFTTSQEGAKIINRCQVVTSAGVVEAVAEVPENDPSWLGKINGKCAVGNFLLSATDDGIVRVEVDNGRLTVAKEFPDTEPFVTNESELYASDEGLYVVDHQEIKLLKIG